jgi:hypothetical protein
VKLTLPKVLQSSSARLQKALSTAIPAVWPEETAFEEADQVRAIGTVLVQTIHKHLAEARIRFLFVEGMERPDRIILGKCARSQPIVSFLAGVDFVITVNWEAYGTLTPEQRIALIDHELCHAGINEKGKWVVLSHDIEEFRPIIRRWGFWKSDVEAFAAEVGAQLELLPGRAMPKVIDA